MIIIFSCFYDYLSQYIKHIKYLSKSNNQRLKYLNYYLF